MGIGSATDAAVISRLKSEMLVKAALRQADIHQIPAVVLQRGDQDAGAIFVEIDAGRGDDGRDIIRLFGRITDLDGDYIWAQLAGTGTAIEVADYLEKERRIDPDFWVISVQDQQGRNIFDLIM